MNVDQPQVRGFFAIPGINARSKQGRRPHSLKSGNHLSVLNSLPQPFRGHVVAGAGEFVGTFMFLFFALSATQVANSTNPNAPVTAESDTSRLLYISIAFGFSLAVNAWVFFRISGGLFNPAVTFGMCLVGAISWIRGLVVFIAQVLGAIASSGVVFGLFPGTLNVRTSLGPGTTVVQGLFIEMFLTAQLVFTIFMLATEKHEGTFIAPVGIGLSLFIAELTGVYWTGGSVNPVRSFGPAVVIGSFYTYHWIYWVGPLLGAILASTFYKLIKSLEYETANPRQDANKLESQTFNPDEDKSQPKISFNPQEYSNQNGMQVPQRPESQPMPNNTPHPTTDANLLPLMHPAMGGGPQAASHDTAET